MNSTLGILRTGALCLSMVLASQTHAAAVQWLDWTALDAAQVASAGGQDFNFMLVDGTAVAVNVRQTLVGGGLLEAVDEPVHPSRSFVSAYTPGAAAPISSVDLPTNESIRYAWTAGGVFDNELTFTFASPVELYLANSELTSSAEQHLWTVQQGGGWTIVDGPTEQQSAVVTSNAFTNDTLHVLGAAGLGQGGYVVGQALSVSQFTWFIDDLSEAATNAESLAVGVGVSVNQPGGISLAVMANILLAVSARGRGRRRWVPARS